MAETVQEMQRQLVAYAMAASRNEGIEDAAAEIDRRAHHARHGAERYDLQILARAIRSLKTDPENHLTEWFPEARKPQEQAA